MLTQSSIANLILYVVVYLLHFAVVIRDRDHHHVRTTFGNPCFFMHLHGGLIMDERVHHDRFGPLLSSVLFQCGFAFCVADLMRWIC